MALNSNYSSRMSHKSKPQPAIQFKRLRLKRHSMHPKKKQVRPISSETRIAFVIRQLSALYATTTGMFRRGIASSARTTIKIRVPTADRSATPSLSLPVVCPIQRPPGTEERPLSASAGPCQRNRSSRTTAAMVLASPTSLRTLGSSRSPFEH